MDEATAKTKWCREREMCQCENTNCIASGCMAWQEYADFYSEEGEPRKGYCGLVTGR